MLSKIGIFSGTFDPVHGGHIAFALSAIEKGGLDKVYLIPEAQPRRKEAVTHYAHRVAMLKLALKPYQKLALLELPDKQFSVGKTLPRLRKIFAQDELFMLIGTDMLALLASDHAAGEWPDHRLLVESVGLVVGVRSGLETEQASRLLGRLQPDRGVVVETDRPHVSSRDIRSALMRGQEHQELLQSLRAYVAQHWLYTHVPSS